jgi:hypothetical protein
MRACTAVGDDQASRSRVGRVPAPMFRRRAVSIALLGGLIGFENFPSIACTLNNRKCAAPRRGFRRNGRNGHLQASLGAFWPVGQRLRCGHIDLPGPDLPETRERQLERGFL